MDKQYVNTFMKMSQVFEL